MTAAEHRAIVAAGPARVPLSRDDALRLAEREPARHARFLDLLRQHPTAVVWIGRDDLLRVMDATP